MTESNIQEKIAQWLRDKGHELVCPNSGVFGWEADLVSVTGAGYGHEYEIKISRSDFRADAKKRKHARLKAGPSYGFVPPVQFWYVVPRGLVTKRECPPHAGLIYLDKGTRPPEIVKPAPRLHTKKLLDTQHAYILRGIMARYWSIRTQLNRRRTK